MKLTIVHAVIVPSVDTSREIVVSMCDVGQIATFMFRFIFKHHATFGEFTTGNALFDGNFTVMGQIIPSVDRSTFYHNHLSGCW